MSDLPAAVVVDFPLRGEWRALNTPAERVPSHGTDYFAQRFAIDFVQMDETGTWYYPGGTPRMLRHVTMGIPASVFHCWGQPVHAAFGGEVLAVRDDWPDREKVRHAWELLRTSAAPVPITPDDWRPLTGNYVLVRGAAGVAIHAHLQRGSTKVAAGQQVQAGEVLGLVGNSGNSTMPHLHFHLMDGPDALTARGLPCLYRNYERWHDGRWERVAQGIPGPLERIRSA